MSTPLRPNHLVIIHNPLKGKCVSWNNPEKYNPETVPDEIGIYNDGLIVCECMNDLKFVMRYLMNLDLRSEDRGDEQFPSDMSIRDEDKFDTPFPLIME